MFKDICVTLAVFYIIEKIWEFSRPIDKPEEKLPVWVAVLIAVISGIILMIDDIVILWR
jgi:hypothetical protein